MILSIKDVLSSKKGIAEALGITMVGITLLTAAGVVVGNYAILSKQAGQLQTLSQELENRAERYASTLNTNLLSPEVPTMARECSTTPAMCTVILSATPSADGNTTVLRIQGDTVSGIGQSLTKDITLVSKEVTHVTAIDADGNSIWALSDEGLHYRVWGRASGEPSVVKPEDMAGPSAATTWVNVADRAGVDSNGALWLWGANNIGQAGIGTISNTSIVPQKFTGATGFRSVVTTDDRGYAIDSGGFVWVWGKNDKGQLGLGTTTNVLVPTKVPALRLMSVAVGRDNVFGITMSGDLVTVGASQVGFPANSGLGWQTLNPGTRYRAVAASLDGAVATISATGTLSMAGNTYSFSPMVGGNFTSVSLGSAGGYAIGASGTLYSWGDGSGGQLGLGTVTTATTPTAVMPETAFLAVSGGVSNAFAVDVAGNLYYWGTMGPPGSVGGLSNTSVPTKLLSDNRFRMVAANTHDPAMAVLDTAGNLYGTGQAMPGLWPMNYMGPAGAPIRMPVPDDFRSNTWK